MIKIHAGGVNAVSGEHKIEDLNTKFRRLKSYLEGKNVQDYVVAPEQPWLDGFATSSGVVRQFVAMPMGEGYSVEAQMTGQEVVGGLQFHITPIKVGPLTLGLFGDLKLFIKTLSGKVTAIYCNREDTIGSLKHIIQEREGMVPENQKWIYAGEQLDDGNSSFLSRLFHPNSDFVTERTLADYDIGNVSLTIHFPHIATLSGSNGIILGSFNLPFRPSLRWWRFCT